MPEELMRLSDEEFLRFVADVHMNWPRHQGRSLFTEALRRLEEANERIKEVRAVTHDVQEAHLQNVSLLHGGAQYLGKGH